MSSIEIDTEELLGLEWKLFDTNIRRSEHVLDLLDEDFIEIGKSGRVYTRAQVIEALREEAPLAWELTGFRTQIVAPHVCLLTYRATSENALTSLRSSLWRRENGRWRMLFHQGTPCPD